MRNTKLYYYLSQLDSKQRIAFREFLASPYFNRKMEVAALYDLLENRLLKYKLRNLSPAEVFQAIFPGQPFNETIFKKLLNRLLGLAIEFLAHDKLHNDKAEMLRVAHNAVAELGADKYFETLHKKAMEAQDPNRMDYFDRAYYLELGLLEAKTKSNIRVTMGDWEKQMHLLNQSSAVKKLYVGFNSQAIAGLIGSDFDREEMERLIAELETGINDRPWQIQLLYFRYLTTFKPANPKHYETYLALLEQYSDRLSFDLSAELYNGILIYCIYRVNAGEESFLPELLRVYKLMLQWGHLAHQGVMPYAHFKNIVVVAARAGESKWAESFYYEYGPQVDAIARPKALIYNRAVLDYFQGGRREAELGFLEIIKDAKDIYYGIDARVYLLRIYFETDNLEGMESLCHSFRVFIGRSKKLSQTRKDRYLTFISLFRRLMNVPEFEEQRLEKLKADILAIPNFAPKEWLLEKVDEMLG